MQNPHAQRSGRADPTLSMKQNWKNNLHLLALSPRAYVPGSVSSQFEKKLTLRKLNYLTIYMTSCFALGIHQSVMLAYSELKIKLKSHEIYLQVSPFPTLKINNNS